MVKIITIDGPASSGKGTVAKIIAKKLGLAYLDSGAIYRALALMAMDSKVVDTSLLQAELSFAQVENILILIDNMNLSFVNGEAILNNKNVSEMIRGEAVGLVASFIAKIAQVRDKLLEFQRDFASEPGLVTDGRDMGSVVFPEASLKIYLTSEAEIRANRRVMQLQNNGVCAKMADILADIERRDVQDRSRASAPLMYDESYKVLDNSNLSIDDTVAQILEWFNML